VSAFGSCLLLALTGVSLSVSLCGVCRLSVALSPLFPESLIVGLEIRERVVRIDQVSRREQKQQKMHSRRQH
jgi:hypothetical protein